LQPNKPLLTISLKAANPITAQQDKPGIKNGSVAKSFYLVEFA
jgi:hypothetical protein